MHFALVHQALLVGVDELDGILDGDHVLVAGLVDQVEHGGQGGGLAAAGRPGHQDQPARLLAQLAKHLRQAQLIEGS